jgi:hypothetical protein
LSVSISFDAPFLLNYSDRSILTFHIARDDHTDQLDERDLPAAGFEPANFPWEISVVPLEKSSPQPFGGKKIMQIRKRTFITTTTSFSEDQ